MAEESATPDLAELVRRSVEPMNRRDIDAAIGFYASDAVWDASSVGLTFEGAVAIRRFLEDWLANYSEWKTVPEEVHDLGNGVTFMVAVQHARLAGSDASVQERWSYTAVWEAGLIRSGLPVTLRLVSVTWFEDGKMTRVRGYLHRREALEAVGLEG
jgi:ketosteroid isomerase-like protein